MSQSYGYSEHRTLLSTQHVGTIGGTHASNRTAVRARAVIALAAEGVRAEGIIPLFIFVFLVLTRGFLASFQLGLVFLDRIRLLGVNRKFVNIPGLFHVPILLEVEFLGIVIYLLGL